MLEYHVAGMRLAPIDALAKINWNTYAGVDQRETALGLDLEPTRNGAKS